MKAKAHQLISKLIGCIVYILQQQTILRLYSHSLHEKCRVCICQLSQCYGPSETKAGYY